jgi:hypothetical protein
MSMLEGWEHIIEQAEALEVNGTGLEITFESQLDLKYALVAMVVYNSRPNVSTQDWGYNLDTDGQSALFISKVSLEEEY